MSWAACERGRYRRSIGPALRIDQPSLAAQASVGGVEVPGTQTMLVAPAARRSAQAEPTSTAPCAAPSSICTSRVELVGQMPTRRWDDVPLSARVAARILETGGSPIRRTAHADDQEGVAIMAIDTFMASLASGLKCS